MCFKSLWLPQAAVECPWSKNTVKECLMAETLRVLSMSWWVMGALTMTQWPPNSKPTLPKPRADRATDHQVWPQSQVKGKYLRARSTKTKRYWKPCNTTILMNSLSTMWWCRRSRETDLRVVLTAEHATRNQIWHPTKSMGSNSNLVYWERKTKIKFQNLSSTCNIMLHSQERWWRMASVRRTLSVLSHQLVSRPDLPSIRKLLPTNRT